MITLVTNMKRDDMLDKANTFLIGEKYIYRNDYDSFLKFVEENLEIINFQNQDGTTLLILAVIKGNLRIVALLLRHGAKVDLKTRGQKWTALHFAARDQNLAIVNLLLTYGVNVDVVDNFGNTPLWRAMMNRNPNLDLIKELINKGADIYKKNNSGVSPYDLVATLNLDSTFVGKLDRILLDLKLF